MSVSLMLVCMFCFDIVTISITVVTCYIFFVFDVGSMYWDIVNMVVTKDEPLSPPNKGNVKKKAFPIKSKSVKVVVI